MESGSWRGDRLDGVPGWAGVLIEKEARTQARGGEAPCSSWVWRRSSRGPRPSPSLPSPWTGSHSPSLPQALPRAPPPRLPTLLRLSGPHCWPSPGGWHLSGNPSSPLGPELVPCWACAPPGAGAPLPAPLAPASSAALALGGCRPAPCRPDRLSAGSTRNSAGKPHSQPGSREAPGSRAREPAPPSPPARVLQRGPTARPSARRTRGSPRRTGLRGSKELPGRAQTRSWGSRRGGGGGGAGARAGQREGRSLQGTAPRGEGGAEAALRARSRPQTVRRAARGRGEGMAPSPRPSGLFLRRHPGRAQPPGPPRRGRSGRVHRHPALGRRGGSAHAQSLASRSVPEGQGLGGGRAARGVSGQGAGRGPSGRSHQTAGAFVGAGGACAGPCSSEAGALITALPAPAPRAFEVGASAPAARTPLIAASPRARCWLLSFPGSFQQVVWEITMQRPGEGKTCAFIGFRLMWVKL